METKSRQIEITYKSISEGEKKAHIFLLTKSEGMRVLHIVMQTLGSLTVGGDIAKALESIDFDRFMSIASPLLRNAVIDLKEIKDLRDTDVFDGKYLDMYALTFSALEANYPDFFGILRDKIGDLIASLGAEKA